MDVLPAIDLSAGRIVRWSRGRAEEVYDADPVGRAERWLAQGATWLHVVDLDRAFHTGRTNADVVRAIAALPGARVQAGGLLQTEDQVREAFDLGAARVVVATAAAVDPTVLPRLVDAFGAERLVAAIDVRDGDGRVALRGSPLTVELSAAGLLDCVVAAGLRTVLYRDLARESTLEGADVAGAAALVGRGARVFVAAGIGRVDHVHAARLAGLAGVILGRALYEGRVTLADALACSA